MRYPKYINGIKQVQCPFKRFFIKLWYSDWFRLFFIICPVWLFVVFTALMACFPGSADIVRTSVIVAYLVLFCVGLICNDYSNLRRIGLNEYHEKLVPTPEDLEREAREQN
jgi:predicted CDP-diglyceride synthetase/phosphatidate cytidylyltransferase